MKARCEENDVGFSITAMAPGLRDIINNLPEDKHKDAVTNALKGGAFAKQYPDIAPEKLFPLVAVCLNQSQHKADPLSTSKALAPLMPVPP